MVASCGVASAACATVSVCGRGVDSSTAADRCSSPAAALGSSLSQDRSVDFLHNTTMVSWQARLPIYMNYSEIDYTHKIDRTTVTVGAPSMLAISSILASTGTSSSTWATYGVAAPVVTEGSGLISSTDARGSSVTATCCAASSTNDLVVGVGLWLLSVALPQCPRFLPPLGPWGRMGEYPVITQDSTVSMQYSVASTRLQYSRNLSPG
jgi:hypothetical protein